MLIKKSLRFAPSINILVNNIAEQHPKDKPEEISCTQFENTFKTNVFSYFYMIKACLPHLKKDLLSLIQRLSRLIKEVIISLTIRLQKAPSLP